jgi:hypothetical protein
MADHPPGLDLEAQLAAHAAAGVSNPPIPGTLPDGRHVQVRPCKYYPNCAKMDDPEHNAMYSHNSVVKKPLVCYLIIISCTNAASYNFQNITKQHVSTTNEFHEHNNIHAQHTFMRSTLSCLVTILYIISAGKI